MELHVLRCEICETAHLTDAVPESVEPLKGNARVGVGAVVRSCNIMRQSDEGTTVCSGDVMYVGTVEVNIL
jgi:hypothetical protein